MRMANTFRKHPLLDCSIFRVSGKQKYFTWEMKENNFENQNKSKEMKIDIFKNFNRKIA